MRMHKVILDGAIETELELRKMRRRRSSCLKEGLTKGIHTGNEKWAFAMRLERELRKMRGRR